MNTEMAMLQYHIPGFVKLLLAASSLPCSDQIIGSKYFRICDTSASEHELGKRNTRWKQRHRDHSLKD
ncbi:hypothetical protein MTO96_049134 [Rhipicephalus appendiculatus]